MASSSKEKIKQFNFKICNNHGETPRERSCMQYREMNINLATAISY